MKKLLFLLVLLFLPVIGFAEYGGWNGGATGLPLSGGTLTGNLILPLGLTTAPSLGFGSGAATVLPGISASANQGVLQFSVQNQSSGLAQEYMFLSQATLGTPPNIFLNDYPTGVTANNFVCTSNDGDSLTVTGNDAANLTHGGAIKFGGFSDGTTQFWNAGTQSGSINASGNWAVTNTLIQGYTTVVTAAATTTLTVTSTNQQFFTGATTQTVVLPVTSTLVLGQQYRIVNTSTGAVTVQSSGANNIQVMAANSQLVVTCILTSGTTAASWQAVYTPNFLSTNTASSAVLRDGSGNFSAGTVTAALTGTASGNLTYSANNHGVVLSSTTNAATVIAPNASTAFPLISGGASADPTWALLGFAGGGTNAATAAAAFNNLSPMTTLGDIEYESAANTASRLAGNTSATKNFLTQTGNGSVSAAPAWGAIAAGDLPTITLTGDVTGAASGGSVATTAAATQANIVTLSKSTGVAVHGTNSNTSAAAGYVGEYVTASVAVATNTPATTVFGDCTSISLTAGDWDVSLIISFVLNGATCTSVTGGISTTTGNSTTGLVYGNNRADSAAPTASVDSTVVIPVYRELLSGTTTVYGKMAATFSAGQPQYLCRLSARRVQ